LEIPRNDIEFVRRFLQRQRIVDISQFLPGLMEPRLQIYLENAKPYALDHVTDQDQILQCLDAGRVYVDVQEGYRYEPLLALERFDKGL
jgi:hypothetical protein